MKILFAHNYYGSSAPSGENRAFDAERAMMARRGHEVESFTRHSDEIRGQGAWGKVKGALSTPWNLWTPRAVGAAVARFRPNVVHVHNTFPLISPAIFSAIGSQSARVLTLHNYRLYCAAATPLRAGEICTECLDRGAAWPAVRHACYRESRFATLPLAINIDLHRTLRTWERHVDAFIVLSDFQRALMVNAGLPADKVRVKPNFYFGNASVLDWRERKPYIMFAGRLTAEKGLATLIHAWRKWGAAAPELRVAGDGALRSSLEALAAGLPVRFLGQLDAAEAQEQIASAKLLVLPSECFEGFPMVLAEAFALGTPVAASDIGPLPAIVEDGVSGLVFAPRNPDAMLEKLRKGWDTPGLLEQLAKGARAAFEQEYAEAVNYDVLISIYRQAIDARQRDADKWPASRPKTY
jgi:glycosyltransferase involved in cell wall biosynthesis